MRACFAAQFPNILCTSYHFGTHLTYIGDEEVFMSVFMVI